MDCDSYERLSPKRLPLYPPSQTFVGNLSLSNSHGNNSSRSCAQQTARKELRSLQSTFALDLTPRHPMFVRIRIRKVRLTVRCCQECERNDSSTGEEASGCGLLLFRMSVGGDGVQATTPNCKHSSLLACRCNGFTWKTRAGTRYIFTRRTYPII